MPGKLGQGKGKKDGRGTSQKRFGKNHNPPRGRDGKNDQLIISARRQRVSDLYRKGHTQLEIARMLEEEGIVASQPTVSQDVRALLEEYRESAKTNTEEARDKQLASIAYLKQRAWDEFEFSRVNRVKVKPSKTDKDQSVRIIEERTEGNPQWLAQIKACEELEAKIKGLMKDTVINNDNRSLTIDWANISVDSVDPIQARIDSVKVLAGKSEENKELSDVQDIDHNS